MANKTADQHLPTPGDDVHAIDTVTDAIDDFDPLGAVECIEESVYVELQAPPESQWYHGRLHRGEAEERLQQAGQQGSYLIRESEGKPGNYVLSYDGTNGFRHFRITAMCGDYYIGGREFDSLSDLIGYYTTCSDLLKGQRLLNPVAPPEPVNDTRRFRAILPYNKIPDTDELSFKKGEIFIVHNDMGNDWYWVESQKSKLSGIVNKELIQELNGNVDPVEDYLWFHHETTKAVARDVLAKAGPNSWLVRPSDSSCGNYTLYFFCEKNIQKFKIEKSGNVYQMGGRFFESILDITERYRDEQIVEGFTLGIPVLREERDTLGAQDIYNKMVQSSGSNFFLKEQVSMRGYLNKRSQRSKKWKYMYFVLNAAESHLIYFENSKRTKPKGLIDLNLSTLYPVHNSLFDRPNCFQLVMSDSLNQHSYYYMCADNSDSAQQWIGQLRRACAKPYDSGMETNTLGSMSKMTELHSLQLKIYNVQHLPLKYIPNAYCMIALNDVKVARTSISTKGCWDEEFLLDDLPLNIEWFTVSVHNKCKRTKDIEVVSTTTQISSLTPGETQDTWHSVSQNSSKLEDSTIRLGAKYLKLFILPIREYDPLQELLLRPDLNEVVILTKVCAEDKILLAKSLLQIFRVDRQEAHLLRTFNDLQIDNEGDPGTLFRSDTIASTFMEQYMTMTCTEFVHKALQNIINKIMDSKLSCEINPSYLDDKSDTTELIQTNAKYLISILSEAVNDIFMSTDACPKVLRYICYWLQKKVKRAWNNDSLVKTRVISGFIFLRLLCPAILNPKKFNLITETPSQTAHRTFLLVANSVIKLANQCEAKEPYMEVINPFLRDNQQRMVMFLDELSNFPEAGKMPDCPPVDLARSLATVLQICIRHKDKLNQYSLEQNQVKTKLPATVNLLIEHEKHWVEKKHTLTPTK